MAADLVGPDVKFHHSKLNFKWAKGGEEVKWHQDITYWPHTNYSPLTIGVYLHDVGDDQGSLAHPAQQIVAWYSARFWTLWVLLIALPLAALLTGCVTLLPNWNGGSGGRWTAKQFWLAINTQLPTQIIVAATLGAGVILTVVVLHMLAN